MKKILKGIREKEQGNKFVTKDIMHVITRNNVEQEVLKSVRSDVVIPNELGNDKPCQGLRHWSLLSNLKNNFSKPVRNDMKKKILKRVQNDAKEENVKNLVPQCPRALMPLKKKIDSSRSLRMTAFTLAEGATHLDLPPTKVKFAFTLAEVLITLGIISVVAAMTIPVLMNNYKAKRLRTQFLKSYSTIQQAFKLMQEDDVSLDPTTYEGLEYAKTFIKYLKGVTYCGNVPTRCFNGVDVTWNYKNISKTGSVYHSILDDGTIILPDGTLLMMENGGKDYGEQVFVTVDINGYSEKPNRWGYDLFTFQLIDEELKAMGDKGTKYTDFDTYCNPLKGGGYNGIACASKAKTDTDYFKWVVKNLK